MRITYPVAALMLASGGCGLVEPEPTLSISGRVLESDGTAAAGAAINIWFESALTGGGGSLARTVADADGRFSAEVGAPEGYSYPNCATMRVTATLETRTTTAYLNWSDKCDLGTTEIRDLELTLPSPLPS